MTPIVVDPTPHIARHIKSEREARGWSQADLAARAGVAKATVSKIEREQMSPTAVMLVRLAAAFDLTLAGLLLRAEVGDGRLVRAADQPVWRDPDTGYLRRQLFLRPDHPVELVEVEMPPGREVLLPASSYAHIRQMVWVREGLLVIIEAGVRTNLCAGDCLGFGPPADTVFANETNLPCTYVVALART